MAAEEGDQHLLDEMPQVQSNEIQHNIAQQMTDALHSGGGNVAQSTNQHQQHQAQISPCLGQEFESFEQAYGFYNLFAKSRGFSIRKNTTRKNKSGKCVKRQFVCSKEGRKKESEESTSNLGHSRTGCKANLWVALVPETSLWRVSEFSDVHNHELATPNFVQFLASHNALHRDLEITTVINELYNEGVMPVTISKMINVLTGPNEQNITRQQVSQQVRKTRETNIGQEAMKIIWYFQERAKVDPTFYFSMQIDKDRTLRSVFWADGKAIDAYLDFCDVIVFDVTYRTNKFKLSFAPFTGINHHRQSTLFGCALLADETQETFVWLFKTWLDCMCNKAPEVIITDQDAAICAAIQEVFPLTMHRYCSWHVGRHLSERLNQLKMSGSQFCHDWDKWFNTKDVVESERLWQQLIKDHDLGNYKWLLNLYAKRHHWVPAYWKDTFTAGMTSSQRSESINSFFDGYVNSSTPLDQFVTLYDKAVTQRRRDEKEQDFRTKDVKPRLETDLEIESQAAATYTRSNFRIFQGEFRKSMSYWKERKAKEGSVTTYMVGKPNSDQQKWKFVIYDKSEDKMLHCSCCKFEIEGILCRHIILVMREKRFRQIPQKYLLRRWSIGARVVVSSNTQSALQGSDSCTNITRSTTS